MATHNFWNTTKDEVIDNMIFDRNDNLEVADFINPYPILNEPHPDTPELSMLTVQLDGNGIGSVSSTPAGIVCGTDCSEMYIDGTVVTLITTPDTGSNFTGWGGACNGTADCVITMDTAKTVTATFTLDTHYYLPILIK
ncbi:MAG: hypothetical protein WBF05_09165, partial [Anaerolineales bacterium]